MLLGCDGVEIYRYVSAFLRKVPPSISLLTLKVEAVSCTGMLVLPYEHIPEDHHLNTHHTENSHLATPVLFYLVVFIYMVGLLLAVAEEC